MNLPGKLLLGKPVAYAGWEMWLMRALFGWLVWQMLPGNIPYSHQPVPNGLGHIIDLGFLGSADLFSGLRAGYAVALVMFVCGVLPVISLGYVAGLLTMVGALENSQGAIGHHLQLVCMVAIAQWLVYLASQGRDWRTWIKPTCEVHQSATHWAVMVIVAGYVTSACVKLIASEGLWIVQLPDISLQLLKTHANVYYDTLIPQDGWMATQLPYLITDHPNLTRLFFAPGLLLELLAFVALIGRRPALMIGLGLLAMHFLVRLVMNLSFGAHEWLLAIYLINLPYFIGLGLGRLWAVGRAFRSRDSG